MIFIAAFTDMVCSVDLPYKTRLQTGGFRFIDYAKRCLADNIVIHNPAFSSFQWTVLITGQAHLIYRAYDASQQATQ
jgi:hypothetical protein